MEIIEIHPFDLKNSIRVNDTVFDNIEELLKFFYNMVVPSYKLGADIEEEGTGLTSRLKELGGNSGSWIKEFTDSLPDNVGYVKYNAYIPNYSAGRGLPGHKQMTSFDKREEYLFYKA